MEIIQIEETDADDVVHSTLCLVHEDELIIQIEDNEEGREWIKKNFMLD